MRKRRKVSVSDHSDVDVPSRKKASKQNAATPLKVAKMTGGDQNLSELDLKPTLKDEELIITSDTEHSDNEVDGISLRNRMKENVLDNAEFFSKLGIESAKLKFDEIKDIKKPKPTSRGFKEQKIKEILPRRKSLRLQNKGPEKKEEETVLIESYAPSKYDIPRKSGWLQMSDVILNDREEGAQEKFLTSLKGLKNSAKVKSKQEPDLEKFIKSTEKMQINEYHVAKVVPERIFSVAIHPTENTVLLAAGDKWGKIGLWDMNSNSNQDGVFCYGAHVRPVKHLCFPRHQPDRLYSCSYDGSLRCLHFEQGKFEEVYSTPEDEDIMVTGFDFFTPNTMIVSQGHGGMTLLDTRCPKEYKVHQISQKTVRSVSIHPQQTDYIATAQANSEVFIWDLRKLNPKKPKHLHILPHSRIVESAFFSPITGKYLLTTASDDKLRLYDTSNVGKVADLHHSVRHNNHTGRWLSKFRAIFPPCREDVFFCGSMNRPRQIEMFNSQTGGIVKTFQNENYLCSVCSLNAFHPTLNVLVGGNSSGRLHVFK